MVFNADNDSIVESEYSFSEGQTQSMKIAVTKGTDAF